MNRASNKGVAFLVYLAFPGVPVVLEGLVFCSGLVVVVSWFGQAAAAFLSNRVVAVSWSVQVVVASSSTRAVVVSRLDQEPLATRSGQAVLVCWWELESWSVWMWVQVCLSEQGLGSKSVVTIRNDNPCQQVLYLEYDLFSLCIRVNI